MPTPLEYDTAYHTKRHTAEHESAAHGAASVDAIDSESELAILVDLATTEASLSGVWKRFLSDGAIRTDLTDAVLDRILNAIETPPDRALPLARPRALDEYTFTHAINVGVLSAAVADAAGLASNDLQDLAVAAFFHDIGQCAVPEDILAKSGRLDDDERAHVAIHPAFGAGILQQQSALPPIASIVAYEHHIRGDGLGYPFHRKPWRTHLASQIVQLADIFDALRTERPYRAAHDTDHALGVLDTLAGAAFDREIFHAFRDHVVPRLAVEGADAESDDRRDSSEAA
ncbi:MAG: HD domain-containing phosphohydrolase [Planctomycetota bacterium]